VAALKEKAYIKSEDKEQEEEEEVSESSCQSERKIHCLETDEISQPINVCIFTLY